MSELPDLPEGDAPPALAALAERLTSLLPARDRDQAHDLLAERVLPTAFSGLEAHPRPRRVAELIYEDLGEQLLAAAPGDRLAALEAAADEGDIRSLAAHAQSLAVARYLSDDPAAADRAGPFLDGDADAWRVRGAEAIAQEAAATREALESWAEHVRSERPDLFETRRIDYLHAKLALGSASSGAFGTAAGALQDFLAQMDEAPARLEIH